MSRILVTSIINFWKNSQPTHSQLLQSGPEKILLKRIYGIKSIFSGSLNFGFVDFHDRIAWRFSVFPFFWWNNLNLSSFFSELFKNHNNWSSSSIHPWRFRRCKRNQFRRRNSKWPSPANHIQWNWWRKILLFYFVFFVLFFLK